MSRISRVLFPESTLQNISSPSRDRLSRLDSLVAISIPPQSFPTKIPIQTDDDGNVNNPSSNSIISSRRMIRNKKQTRVQSSRSNDKVMNSLMNIGEVHLKENEVNSKQKRNSSNRMYQNPFSILANIGNHTPSSSGNTKKKKKDVPRVRFENKVHVNNKEREERYLKRSLTRKRSMSLELSQINTSQKCKNDVTKVGSDPDDINEKEGVGESETIPSVDLPLEGVDFEDTSSPNFASTSKEPKIVENSSNRLNTDSDTLEETLSRRNQVVNDETLSPSVAPKPLKRLDIKRTPEIKVYKTQDDAESPNTLDEIQHEAEFIVQAVIQAKSIVALTDVSLMSNDDIERISSIQSRAIVLGCPEFAISKSSKYTKPSAEQITRRIELQTKALIDAYKYAKESVRCDIVKSLDKQCMYGRSSERKHVNDTCESPFVKSNLMVVDNFQNNQAELAESFTEVRLEQPRCTISDHNSGSNDKKTDEDHSKIEAYLGPSQNPWNDFLEESGCTNGKVNAAANELQNERCHNNKKYIGRRVAGYFPMYKKYFLGLVEKVYNNDEEAIFKIKYDDGDEEYILFSDDDAIEGRDLKRLLETYEKYGEAITKEVKKKNNVIRSKLSRKKKSKNQSSSVSKKSSAAVNEASLRPRRNVRPVERLEVGFRRKKKKHVSVENQKDLDLAITSRGQLNTDNSDDNSNPRHSRENTEGVRRSSRQVRPANSEDYESYVMKKNKKISASSESKRNPSKVVRYECEDLSLPESNAYLRIREQKIARNQDKLKELGLIDPTIPKHVDGSSPNNFRQIQDQVVTAPSSRRRSSRNIQTTDAYSDENEENEMVAPKFEQDVNQNEWNSQSLFRLKRAHATCDPLSPDFWSHIAISVGEHTAEECRDKWFDLFHINENKPKAGSKVKHSEIPSKAADEEDDIFNSTPLKDRTNIQLRVPSSIKARTRLSRLSEILSSPIFKKINVKKKCGGDDHDENESPKLFRSQFKSYVKEVKAGGIDSKNKLKSKKFLPQLIPKGRLRATAESGDIQIQGHLSPGGTLRLDQPDEDEIENARLYEDEVDNDSDDCSL